MSECMKREKIPEKFRSCFWDTEFGNLDKKDMAYYRMTEYGCMSSRQIQDIV